MQTYVFTKNVSLGFLKRNAKAGETVKISENYIILKGQKLVDLRDMQILKRHGFVIPYDQKNSIQIKIEQQRKQNDFGFSVKKQNEQSKSIPLDKFTKTIEINQDEPFIEQNGVVTKQLSQGVHVASAKKSNKKEDNKKNTKKDNKFGVQVKKQSEQTKSIPLSQFTKTIEINQDEPFIEQSGIIKTQKQETVNKVAKPKKSSVKKTKKTTDNSKKTEKTVRGMKVIKES